MTYKTLIFHNANILTMNNQHPRAEVVIVDAGDGRIVKVGTNEELASITGPDVRRIDLQGKTLIPGFNDCHMHILPYGLDLAQADLSPTAGVTSVPELIAALRRWVNENPQSEWALGNRYDQNTFPGAAHPTCQDLDAAFPDRPVYVMQTSKHGGAANSVALKLAGITANTPDPDGGEIVRDGNGEPTGVLMESALGLVTRHIPRPDKAGMVAAIRRANEALLRAGITSASDLNTGWYDMSTEIDCYKKASEEESSVRMTVYPHAPEFGAPEDVPTRAAFAEAHGFSPEVKSEIENRKSKIRLGPAKLFSDGALTVRTAALREPYVDGSGSGMLLHPPDELKAYILAAHLGGWQVAVHAIGDRAVELVLDGYAEAQAKLPRPGIRHRVEHAMLLDDNLIRRFVEQQVIPVVQPEFLSRLGDAYVLGLGLERASRLNPTASLQKAGLGVPFSSDCPIVPGAPLDGIRAAARRISRTGRLLGPEERVSAMDGLRNYTYWAAYSTFDESETGRIMPGLRADFTVLSADPTVDLDAASVVATIINGRTVYGAEALQ
jgi:predicted amidohydrolase YtcJ